MLLFTVLANRELFLTPKSNQITVESIGHELSGTRGPVSKKLILRNLHVIFVVQTLFSKVSALFVSLKPIE
jgi:hypothetical protein